MSLPTDSDGVAIPDSSARVSPGEISTTETISDSDEVDLFEEAESVRRQIQEMSRKLVQLATNRMNVDSLIDWAEQNFCPITDPASKTCWNGKAFEGFLIHCLSTAHSDDILFNSSYNKSVTPFNMNDQRFNPEVPITGADLYSISMSQRVLDENFESQTEPPQADLDQNEAESSGFRPIFEDIGFMPSFREADTQSVSTDNSNKAEAVVDCAPDDEDCVAEFFAPSSPISQSIVSSEITRPSLNEGKL
ncbi:hypothetical protein FBUS_03678 [Fasciolopsis buskii]|uniref:Uncharacterized protein n=1 Tax=Fasciolopsis buskii TaxID=27845 RepID=A0A8E0RLZ5_9TREM|nr:hypothetical protein FBUS_03678 [Fasciolopsis buski]